MLKGKAHECFFDYIHNRYSKKVPFHFSDTTCLNALIIEWLDSVGIYITVNYEVMVAGHFNAWITRAHLSSNLRLNCRSRAEATGIAIKEAIDIYNKCYEIPRP